MRLHAEAWEELCLHDPKKHDNNQQYSLLQRQSKLPHQTDRHKIDGDIKDHVRDGKTEIHGFQINTNTLVGVIPRVRDRPALEKADEDDDQEPENAGGADDVNHEAE